MLGAFLVDFGPRGWPLGLQMVELGCQDTDWVRGNDRGFRGDFTQGQKHQ